MLKLRSTGATASGDGKDAGSVPLASRLPGTLKLTVAIRLKSEGSGVGRGEKIAISIDVYGGVCPEKTGHGNHISVRVRILFCPALTSNVSAKSVVCDTPSSARTAHATRRDGKRHRNRVTNFEITAITTDNNRCNRPANAVLLPYQTRNEADEHKKRRKRVTAAVPEHR